MLNRLLYILLFSVPAFSQVNVEWINRFNGTDNRFDIANTLKLDQYSNVYVYGTASSSSTFNDIVVIKYSPNGQTLWQRLFNGFANSTDQVNDAFLDMNSNSYITGFTTDTNFVLKPVFIKLDSQGNIIWSRIFFAAGYNQGFGTSVMTDANSNVVASSVLRRNNSTFDILIVKYSPEGNLINHVIFSAAANSNETPVSLALDGSGNIYIMGISNTTGTDDILLQKYSSSLQNIWSITFGGNAKGDDKAVKMIYTKDKKLALTCAIYNLQSGYDYAVYKYDTNSVRTMQYIFNGVGNNQDLPYAISEDQSGNLVVTGSSRNADTLGSEDAVTVKVSPLGSLLWSRFYNGIGRGMDYGASVSIDKSGDIYIGGTTDKHDNHLAYALLKYNSLGDLQWLEEYSRIENSEDFIYTVETDINYNVFVTGISFDSVSDYDIATIKYSQPIGINTLNGTVPNDFFLHQNYPNPFNPGTKIRFGVPKNSNDKVVLNIYDVSGKLLSQLVESELTAGNYEVSWDGTGYASGIYFCSLIYGDIIITNKMILIK